MSSGRIVIDPLDESCIQPASVDLHLDRYILQFRKSQYSYIDVRENLEALTEQVEIPAPAPFILQSGQFILASTLEYIALPDDIVARLEGKSSLGRLGLLIHSTAGYVDPGWKGTLTLEISNVARIPITLYYRMEISQISFLRLSTAAERPYGNEELGSKYQGQVGVTATRIQGNFDLAAAPPRRSAEHGKYNHELRKWLINSRFDGSVRDFAHALEVDQKTAEGWVYGRYRPSRGNKAKIFKLTGLNEYAVKDFDGQQKLLPIKDV